MLSSRSKTIASALSIITVLAAVASAACGSGTGPIGVDPIGYREDPGSTLDRPGVVERGSTPTDDDDANDDEGSPPTGASDAGGASSGLAALCFGTYDCAGTSVTLTQADGQCTFMVSDLLLVLHPDGRLTTADGQPAGTWSGDTSGFVVNGPGKTTTCTPAGTSSSDAG